MPLDGHLSALQNKGMREPFLPSSLPPLYFFTAPFDFDKDKKGRTALQEG